MLTTSDLHTGPVGRDWMAFVAATKQSPKAGDGADRFRHSPPAAAATPRPQPAPSPSTTTGGAR